MKISQKLDLLEYIGRELQSKYTYNEIDTYLAAFGIPKPENVEVNSKRVYAKAALSNVDTEKILSIAEDLEIPISSNVTDNSQPEAWKSTQYFRLFISHISDEKQKAIRLREALVPYGISGFVAHEDINPTLEWQLEVERALASMDAFVGIHTPGFASSNWTQQEIGFAVARGVKIISLDMGELPTGFISRLQALPRRRKRAEEVAREIDKVLTADTRTRDKLFNAAVSLGLISP